MSNKIQPTYPIFNDVDGDPLDAGFIFIGEEGKNPEVYPVHVFWDEELTLPAAQPIRTRNGFLSQNGRPGKIYIADAGCSITVKNKRKSLIFTDLHADLSLTFIGFEKNAVTTVDSILDLASLTTWVGRTVQVKSYHSGQGVGGDLFTYDVLKSEINNGVTIINGWVRASKEVYLVEDAGALVSSADNSLAFDKLVSALPNNSKILFPSSKTIYGHFISLTKAFDVNLNGCTLVNTVTNKPILQIGDLISNEHNVVEATLSNGATQFTVINASTLFKTGDIGYLWDSAMHPSGGTYRVNREVVKIKAISGNIVTIENFLAAYKGAGAIKFYHSQAQLKNATYYNGKFKPTNTHNWITSLIANAENSIVKDIETIGTTGAAVCLRYCYGSKVDNIKMSKANDVLSGNGYGLQLESATNSVISNIFGSGMRHVYDQDSSYFFNISNISDDDDQSAIVGLAHTGFAGYGVIDGVRGITPEYPVVLSEQGYGGSPSAQKGKHPFRNITIKNVDVRIKASSSIDSGCYGVYFQNSIECCHVENIKVELLTSGLVTAGSGSILIRVNGISTGGSTFKILRANKIGKVFFSSGTRDSFAYDYSKLAISDVYVGVCAYVYHAQGLYHIDLDKVTVSDNALSGKIGLMQATGVDDYSYGATHSNNVNYRVPGSAQLDCTSPLILQGSLPLGIKTFNDFVPVAADSSISLIDLQEKSACLKLAPPLGTGVTITMNATTALPKPQTVGDELYISCPSVVRNNVKFLASATIGGDFIVNGGEVVHLRVTDGRWTVVSRSSAN